jgi:hypothetical protein
MEPDAEEIMEAMNFHRSVLIKQFVDENNLIQMINDYSPLLDYYYNKEKNILYKVSNICDETMIPLPNFIIVKDDHILKINGWTPVNNNDN